MGFLTVTPSSFSPIQSHPKTHKSKCRTALPPLNPLQNRLFIPQTISQPTNFYQNHLSFSQTAYLFKITFKRNHTAHCLLSSVRSELRNLLCVKTASFLKIPSTQLSNHLRIHFPLLKSYSSLRISSTHFPSALQNHLSIFKTVSFIKTSATHLSNPLQKHLLINKASSFLKIPAIHLPYTLQYHLSIFKTAFLLLMTDSVTFPSFAAETAVPTEQISDKINIESILISIDDFFNRYPFFVASVTFVWLVVIPIIQDNWKKFKYISAFDSFRRLKDDPNTQLLDIRKKQSLLYLDSPNLKILKKRAVRVEFPEGGEEGFVKEVLMNFGDPGNTNLCVLDNFDGNSLKVAELLFKNGFKEAYAVKGGLRGKDGWQEIQVNLLPPSVHVYPRKKGRRKTYQNLDVSREKIDEKNGDNTAASTSILLNGDRASENGYIKLTGTAPRATCRSEKPLSPYPNYPDMKPPSTPTPSKPN